MITDEYLKELRIKANKYELMQSCEVDVLISSLDEVMPLIKAAKRYEDACFAARPEMSKTYPQYCDAIKELERAREALLKVASGGLPDPKLVAR